MGKKGSGKAGRIVVYSLLGVTSVVVGVIGGFWIYNLTNQRDELDVDTAGLADDIDALMSRYDSHAKEDQASIDYTQEFYPFELVNIGYALSERCEHFSSQGVGVGSAAGVNLDVHDTYVKDGDNYYEEMYSKTRSDLVNVVVCFRMYEDPANTTIYKGQFTDGINAARFDENSNEVLPNADYKSEWGRGVSDGTAYIISSKTVYRSVTNYGTLTSAVKTKDGYEVELELNEVTGVANYQKQMVHTSGLEKKPTFEYVHLSFKLDHSLRLIESTSTEKYSVIYSPALPPFATSMQLRTLYTYDTDLSVPALNEPVEYRDSF